MSCNAAIGKPSRKQRNYSNVLAATKVPVLVLGSATNELLQLCGVADIPIVLQWHTHIFQFLVSNMNETAILQYCLI